MSSLTASEPLPPTGHCRACGQVIRWVTTAQGRQMPCEPDRVEVVTTAGKIERGFQPHWPYCPGADQMRRKRGRDDA